MKHLNKNNTTTAPRNKRSRKVENIFLLAIFIFACFGTYHICKSQAQPKAEKIEYEHRLGSR